MVPAPEDTYFPALDQCLKGARPLISWEVAYIALCDLINGHDSAHFEQFLRDETTKGILQKPLSSFQPPSPQSKSDFETRTAAINVLPSNSGSYDINQLKADAQWLSKKGNVDEVSALRIVILEWQQRSATHLASEWSEDEVLSLGNTNPNSSLYSTARPSIPASIAASSGALFLSDEHRHVRLFQMLCQERVFVLRVSESLVGFAQPPELQPAGHPGSGYHVADKLKVRGWLPEYAKAIWHAQSNASGITGSLDQFSECVSALKSRLEAATNASNWPDIVRTNSRSWTSYTRCLMGEITTILRLVLLHVNSSKNLPSAERVLDWYDPMDQYSFLADLQVIFTDADDLVLIAHCLVALISTSLLQVTQSLEYFHSTYAQQGNSTHPELKEKPYLENDECVRRLTTTLLGATTQSMRHASPAVLAWSIVAQNVREVAILGRGDAQKQIDEGSSDSEQTPYRRTFSRDATIKQSKPEILLDVIMNVGPQDDLIAAMGNGAVNDMSVFEHLPLIAESLLNACGSSIEIHTAICGRLIAYELIRDAIPLIRYGPDVVQAIMSVLSYNDRDSSAWPAEPARTLLEDGVVMGPRFMDQVISRYPYEMPPFLACMSAIARSVASADEGSSRVAMVLESMVNFTSTLPVHFDAYDLVREDEMANCIRLTQDLSILAQPAARGIRLLQGTGSNVPEHEFAIPAGTVGFVLNDNRPFVVCWQFEHSGLEYLGRILSTRTTNTVVLDPSFSGPIDQETTSDIIGLVTNLLESLICAGDAEAARRLLGQISNGLERNDDVIRVVLEIFEQELQTKVDRPGIDETLFLLTNCIRFMRVVLDVYPDRVWSFLLRSKLLAVGENMGALSAIVGATEVPLGQYPFLRSCVSLFQKLVDDAVKRAVSRKGATKTLTRFEERNIASGSTPEKLLSLVLVTFSRLALDIFSSQASWRFDDPADKREVNTGILRTLKSILDHTYGTDDASAPTESLTGFLFAASETILDVYLGGSDQSDLLRPILDLYTLSLTEPGTSSTDEYTSAVLSQSIAAASFCSTIVQVSVLLRRPGNRLMTQLFEAVPVLARLYATHVSLNAYVADLLTAMVQASNQDDKEPPSLLGHLSPEASKSFLGVISQLDQPLQKVETEIKLWDMLSAVVSNKQQWLAICLLTGTTPRDRLKRKPGKDTESGTTPLLSQALDHLSNIGALVPRRATAMLAFVSLAQSHWPWATKSIGAHPTFITNVTAWLPEVTVISRSNDAEEATRSANENQMAAYIADILATYMYNARHSGQASIAKTVASKLRAQPWLTTNGISVDGYNHSLHKNLAKNFDQKFRNCRLDNFKRTALISTDLGRNYYYDLDLMSKMLSFEPSWTRNKQGFANEIARANVNLSLVESQVSLLKSWKSLVMELSECSAEDAEIQRDLVLVIQTCLKANMDASVPSALFDNLSQLRADLAFVLLQRLVGIKSREVLQRELVSNAWDVLRACGSGPEVSSSPKEAAYYQSLLRVLFLSLQPFVYDQQQTNSKPRQSTTTQAEGLLASTTTQLVPVLLEILDKVITRNFRALCSSVHEDPQSVEPGEFVLLTALLQTILRIPGITATQQQIASIFGDASVIKLAVSLFSWSDALADPVTLDPIYGEIGILFLLSLSTVQHLAEQMAVEGVLSHLSSANISLYLRKGNGKGPFDAPVRMHDIWTRGLLPLCLNLLEAVGPPIATEIASFVNSFPAQLGRAQTDLQNVSPSMRQPHAGAVTLGLASETHSLSLLSLIIERLKALGPAAGVVSAEIPSLSFDRVAVKEEVEGMLRGRRNLRERITAVGEREAQWARMKPDALSGEVGSKLEEKVVAELEAVVECLGS